MKKDSAILIGTVITATLFFTFFLPKQVFAVSTITISPAGDGVYALQGLPVENASALDITIMYDTTTLTNPQVVEGPLIAGAMTAINPNIPGTVRIVIIRIAPINGSGVIATLNFDTIDSSPGKISQLTARLANATGSPLTAQTQIINPTDLIADSSTISHPQNAPVDSTLQPTATGTSIPTTPSSIAPSIIIAGQPTESVKNNSSSPGDSKTGDEGQQSTSDTSVNSESQTVTIARSDNSSLGAGEHKTPLNTQTPSIYVHESILDRFREYKGERSADAFISLFEQESLFGFRQNPSVAFSDGKTIVTVTFIAPPGNLISSDLTITEAKLLSLKKDPDNSNTWIASLLPNKGAYEASITISQNKLRMIYPITVAPKVNLQKDKSGKITKNDFDQFLKNQKIVKTTAMPVSSDSKWDYKDDFIFTANYLRSINKFQ